MKKKILIGSVAFLLIGFAVVQLTCLFGCGGKVPSQFRPTETVSSFTNADWATVLSKVVTEDGFVHHERIADNTDGVRDALYRYVGLIGEVSPLNRPELFPTEKDKLAYWINAYNAVCMYDVNKRGRPASIKNAGGIPYAIFYFDKFPYGGTDLTLDGVEKQYVRSVGDPRVHFALNCSSYSCPPLRAEPYEAAKLDAQFDDQGRRYLSDPRGAVRDGDNVKLGEIFKFYQDEFLAAYRKSSGKSDAGLLEAIQSYAGAGSPILGAKGYTFMEYDWSINQAK
jgi:Protein of unknown function, DUF547